MPSSSSRPAVPPHDEPPADDPGEAADREPPASWPLWTVPAALGVGLVLALLATSIVDAVASAGGGSFNSPGTVATIIGDVVFDLCFVGAALWLSLSVGRARLKDFGFRRLRPSTAVAAVVVAAILYYGVTALSGALVHLHGKDKLPSELDVTHSTAALVAVAIFVCAVAPICEEFFFRGFIFGALRNIPLRIGGVDGGPWLAAVITGILFGAVHTSSASPQYLIPLGFLGFVLCLVRWRTRSLYPCMALHSANNALALGVNQLSWSALAIVGLVVASWLVIAAVVGPLARPSPRPA
jgi:uncharacterized protein